MTREDLLRLLDRVGGGCVLVAGDLYLDRYVFGTPSRISREAPVMVLNEERQEDQLGGGAAPALALAALGCQVAVAGVVGDDAEGVRVRELLAQAGIETSGVVVDPARPTTTKMRVVAEGFFLFPQQIVRLDRQERAAVSSAVEGALCTAIEGTACDAVLVSDYRSGVMTPDVVGCVRGVQDTRGVLTTVDSQGELTKFAGLGVVKCNQAEAEAVLGHPLGDRTEREQALTALRGQLGSGELIVTRGGEGASLAMRDGYAEVPAFNRSEIFDVTGAGDTVVAVLTAGLLAGGSVIEATQLAQAAAGVVVRKWGNAQATSAEIAEELRRAD
jgi:D-glycero-beta-D-manno-heptose-7-phosphate kinase